MDVNGELKKFRGRIENINGEIWKCTWRIENFSSITVKKLYSDVFDFGGNKWQLVIFPKGNKVDYLSIYLAAADAATLPYGWSRYAQLRLAVIDQIDHKTSIIKDTTHEFEAKILDWGFASFLPLSELHNPRRGYLVNDACLVEAIVFTDRTIDLRSYEFVAETGSEKHKSKGADCAKAAVDNQETITTKPAEVTTPSPTIVADKASVPEDTTEEDMNTFFTSLESELASSNIVSSQEEAKEALAELDKALNMAPAIFYDSGKFFPVKKAFKILTSFDCSSTFTIEQKNELLAMEENLKELAGRAVKAVQDKNLLTAKESVKLKITRNLERSLIRFKEAKTEVKQIEQKLAALNEQVGEAQKNRENILAERKEIFRSSKELKMELEALGKEWPEYEAKAKVAEEEKKTVAAEWGRMKDFISSMRRQI